MPSISSKIMQSQLSQALDRGGFPESFDYQAKDENGNTYLHYAVANKRSSQIIIQQLMSKTPLKSQNKLGNTPLHIATKCGYINFVDILLKKAKKDNIINELLLKENKNKQTALSLAALLKVKSLYKKLVTYSPGYDVTQLYSIKKNRLTAGTKIKRNAFIGAILDTFCPSGSASGLIEPLILAGLVGSSFLLSAGIGIVAVVSFTVITFFNYRKNKIEANHSKELIELEYTQALLKNLRESNYINELNKKLKKKQKLNDLELAKIHEIKKALNTVERIKPFKPTGGITRPADYATTSDKVTLAFSTTASILCSASGLLGLTTLGIEIAASAMAVSSAALIATAGPVGIAIFLTVCLVAVIAIGVWHYKTRKKELDELGAIRQKKAKIHDSCENLLQETKLSQKLEYLEKGKPFVETRQAVIPLRQEQKLESKKADESKESLLNRADSHGHPPGEICQKDLRDLQSLSLVSGRRMQRKTDSLQRQPIPILV